MLRSKFYDSLFECCMAAQALTDADKLQRVVWHQVEIPYYAMFTLDNRTGDMEAPFLYSHWETIHAK